MRHDQTTMGHHCVPQAYLRAFESKPNSGLIWMCDRTTKVRTHVPIKAAAQSPDFSEHQVERELSAVEGPAHAALARVLEDSNVTLSDRDTLPYYIAVLMYRIPVADADLLRAGGPPSWTLLRD